MPLLDAATPPPSDQSTPSTATPLANPHEAAPPSDQLNTRFPGRGPVTHTTMSDTTVEPCPGTVHNTPLVASLLAAFPVRAWLTIWRISLSRWLALRPSDRLWVLGLDTREVTLLTRDRGWTVRNASFKVYLAPDGFRHFILARSDLELLPPTPPTSPLVFCLDVPIGLGSGLITDFHRGFKTHTFGVRERASEAAISYLIAHSPALPPPTKPLLSSSYSRVFADASLEVEHYDCSRGSSSSLSGIADDRQDYLEWLVELRRAGAPSLPRSIPPSNEASLALLNTCIDVINEFAALFPTWPACSLDSIRKL